MQPENHADTQMPLRVARAFDVAKGLRSFELVLPDGSDLPEFTPGAHIKVQTPNGMLRKYSLCNSPTERKHYVITVKREDDSRGGSASMHDDLQEGHILPTSVPENAFPLVYNAKAYLFIAGGIGITPMLSMIRSFGEEAPAPWKLIYLSRFADNTAFLEELGHPDLKKYVKIHHSEGKPDQKFDLWPALEKPNSAHVYCCGPRGLMEAVRDMTGHWSPKNVHFESFEEGGRVMADDKAFHVTLSRQGRRFEVPVGTSILNAMRAHGCNAAASCESGTCGTCRTALIEGVADHRDMVLMPEEMESQIMICVSRAKSAELVLDI